MKRTSKKTISIIVPVYNSESTISKCIQSILDNSFNDFELIIINDGSKDSSEQKIRTFKDERIHYVCQKNSGQSATRNKGLSLATGEYVMFVDSDDFLDKDYLESMYKCAKNNNADVVVSGFKNIGKEGNLISVNKYTNNKMSQYSMLMPWGKIFRHSLLNQHGVQFGNLNYWEDHAFSFVAYSYANKIITNVNNQGYNYYYNENGLTKTKFTAFRVNLIPTFEFYKKEINPIDLEKNKDFWSYIFLKEAICHLLESGKDASLEEFLRRDKICFNWIENNICKIKDIKIQPKEKTRVKIIICSYLLIRKMKLLKFFSKIYCKPLK